VVLEAPVHDVQADVAMDRMAERLRHRRQHIEAEGTPEPDRPDVGLHDGVELHRTIAVGACLVENMLTYGVASCWISLALPPYAAPQVTAGATGSASKVKGREGMTARADGHEKDDDGPANGLQPFAGGVKGAARGGRADAGPAC
jgi:hypothetical protein